MPPERRDSTSSVPDPRLQLCLARPPWHDRAMRRMWAIAAALVVTAVAASGCSIIEESDAVGTWGTQERGSAHLQIADDGTLHGNDGCNSFSGRWHDADGAVIFDDVMSTLMACQGVDTWLTQGRSAVARGDTLHVRDASGTEIGTLPRVE